jgi:uncharacterized protein YqgC (DUF456 family)
MMIDTALMIGGGLCMVIGILGCLVPILPGPPFSYLGLILLQLTTRHPFSPRFLILYGILTVLALVIDYVIPIYGTKKFQGTAYGIWGSIIGMIIGIMFFSPFGIIFGPLVGAFLGELFAKKDIARAMKSSLGSLIGFLAGTAIKLVLSMTMAYYYVINLL